MEHIYFEAQLCSEIAILKEKSKKLKILRKSFDWWRDISFLHAMGQGSGQMGELLGRRHRRRHLETQVDVQARKL